VPRREDRQRAEQAHPRTRRAGLSDRAVQARGRVGAGCGEHVLPAGDEFRSGGLVQAQRGDRAGQLPGQLGQLPGGDHPRRLGAADHVALRLLDDALRRVLLGRRGGGQVVVGLDLGAVVRVDERPGRAVPGLAVPQ
jgi:hypothetical protein